MWDDEHLVFLDIHSPNTVANLRSRPAVEVNVVDPIVRKGYRFKGRGEVLTGPAARRGARPLPARPGLGQSRVKAVVLIAVETAALLVSPAYDDAGVTEAEVAARWRAHHLALHPDGP